MKIHRNSSEGRKTMQAIQDYYPDDVSYCYGCGRLNEYGHQLKSYWDGDETVARITPKPFHTAIPGYVYGGLIASLIDCHGTGTAALESYRAEAREPGTQPPFRFVTASLHVDYLMPTPLSVELKLRGKIIESKGRKVISEITVFADRKMCARGTVVAVQMPENMIKK
jgi:acyl-coenzyme A thioesterase PaaI-like protein